MEGEWESEGGREQKEEEVQCVVTAETLGKGEKERKGEGERGFFFTASHNYF